MRRIYLPALLALCVILCSTLVYGYESGDTGTYRILDYKVVLTPQADGLVTIDYYQKWLVNSGHIPWITVGVPNPEYQIASFGLAANQASPNNYGGESLVRIDLDRDYQPNQTFEIKFSITQNQLFYPEDSSYKLDFIPGWYDRAQIDNLEIRVKPPVELSDVTTAPPPSSQSDVELIWRKTQMGEGDRFHISVKLPKTSFPAKIDARNLRRKSGSSFGSDAGAVFGFIFFIVLIVIAVSKVSKNQYTGGNISRGGHYGGSGCVYSCACACAGCACACACAGGGGAGCSRKAKHQCALCTREAKKLTDQAD